MMLERGSRVGPYEVVSPIGAGGMGEVYKARDPRLVRDVALKVLPAGFVHDPDRVARFQREAQVLATLNHPHIAHLYGLEEVGGTTALVLEFVDGETLSDVVARGPLPVQEAVKLAHRIADALEAAHEHGIVHRDLKPANIKVDHSGQLKVLDFGLAKALQGESSASGPTDAPTVTSASTRLGVVLGTAAYMSPEQARGLPVDRRADIWAFGCVLFEMLAGSPAFVGATASDILAAVLQGEPEWQKLPAGLPPSLVRVLRRCLEKDLRRRFHDIADVRIALEDGALEPAHVPDVPRRRSRVLIPVALIAAVAAGALVATVVRSRQASGPAESITFELLAPPGSEFGSEAHFALSPDGRSVLLLASPGGGREIWIHSLASGTAQRLADTRGAALPFWSADGRAVGFFAEGKLKKIDTSGAIPAVELCDVPIARGGTWNARNEIVFANVDGPLQKINANGGAPTILTTLDAARGDVAHIRPQFLPDGRHVLFTAVGTVAEARVVSLDDPTRHTRLGLDAVAQYSSGYLVFYKRGSLLAQPFELSTQRLTGDPITVVPRTGGGTSRNLLTPFSTSGTGTLSFMTYVPTVGTLTWFDRSGNALGTVGEPGEYDHLALSADETRLAVSKRHRSAEASVWVFELPRASARRITHGREDTNLVRWSPDRERLIFSAVRDSAFNVLLQTTADGSGQPELLLNPGIGNWLNDWSPDGRFVLYAADSKTTSGDLWILPMTGERTPKPFLNSPYYEGGGAFSPDGRWVAYTSNVSGRSEIHVSSFLEPAAQRQISTTGGFNPVWRNDGRELFFVRPDQMLMSARLNGNEVSDVKQLFRLPVPLAASGRWHQYTVNRDGSRILAIVPEPQTQPKSVTVVANWPGLLNAR